MNPQSQGGARRGQQDEAAVVPLPPEPIPDVTQVRSTLLTSSVLTLRERGHDARYFQRLPREHHELMLGTTAGGWVPIAIADAHYRAIEALELPNDEQWAIATAVADRIHRTFLGTLVRMAKGIGVTPWIGLDYYQKLWQRLFVGGAAAVYKLGPKEARTLVVGLPLLAIPYFRTAFRGVNHAGVSLFCRRLYVNEIEELASKTRLSLRVSWV